MKKDYSSMSNNELTSLAVGLIIKTRRLIREARSIIDCIEREEIIIHPIISDNVRYYMNSLNIPSKNPFYN